MGISFIRRQQRDWQTTVMRTWLDKLAYQMVYPYLSIFIVALGATATQLGIVTSIGMAIAGLISPFTGWFIDRIGPKKIYLFGIGMLAVSYLSYGIARNWTVTIIAMVAYWIGLSTSIHSCATVCGNCLANEDRATGMTICETFAAGLLGMAGPLMGTWLVAAFGGVNPSGIRPLFFVGLAVSVSTFLLVLARLSNRKWITSNARPDVFRDIYQVLKEGRHLKRWLVIAAVGQLPLGMVFPFSQVFAYQVKGANEFILGAIVTGSALTSIAFAIPLGRLADKVGRKKILYITIPLFWASILMLVWAPTPVFLVVAGVLQGFYYVGSPISAAMERELVPAEQMGRWLGITRSFRLMSSAALTLLSGIIWDKIGPQYVFLAFVGLDLVLRVPLLLSMPETLRLRVGRPALADAEG